jgi:hypothetical protein
MNQRTDYALPGLDVDGGGWHDIFEEAGSRLTGPLRDAVEELAEAPEPEVSAPDPMLVGVQRRYAEFQNQDGKYEKILLALGELLQQGAKTEGQNRLLELALLGLDQTFGGLRAQLDLHQKMLSENAARTDQLIRMFNSGSINEEIVRKAIRVVQADRARDSETADVRSIHPEGGRGRSGRRGGRKGGR